ncbi:XRE family transcriptional regulator [Psychromarinibacter sp. C21-152]|uniref:XRE family transcriptional regulator n=1 Tax=Psychromarinibacter sediminicola TaxID=3033385 RepID=A0AAE3TAP1_9RHOB|nr:XRE family transcriptional regulator [Psychromarinibacter sediminicola]MDF0603442.1 XRE family transcriptional regulator [Psychromarinibacter sediminicola]
MNVTKDTDLPRDAQDSRARLAARARHLRQVRGLTLQQVADRASLAVSTVSKIERGLMAPTFDRFAKLAEGLGVDVAELFSDRGSAFADGEFAICRKGGHGFLATENYTYEMLFPEVRGKAMVPMLGTLKPLEEMRLDRMVRHPGEEFLHVLEGRVTIRAEGRGDVALEAGESVYFDSNRGHLYASAGETPARILVVCTGIEG